MKQRAIILHLITLLAGIAIGLFARQVLHKYNRPKDKTGYIERHQGQSKHINPLLGCDVAEDVLSDPEIGNIKQKIEPLVKSSIDKRLAIKVGVYFRELNDGYWFSIGETEKFVPASLRKIPLMIALLKQSERDRTLLDRSVKFDLSQDYNLNQNLKPSKTLVFGNSYTIRDLIYRMIVYSDNNAFTYLTKVVDSSDLEHVY